MIEDKSVNKQYRNNFKSHKNYMCPVFISEKSYDIDY